MRSANLPGQTASKACELVVVAGQTASGKSEFAIGLAQLLTRSGRITEIVNADAMQLYRGMNIGTAKLSAQQRGGIPHHLIDVLDPAENCSAVRYRELATPVIEDLLSRGVLPLVTGGSMFYLASLTDELEFAPSDPQLRAELEAQLELSGAQQMHARLAKLDPAAAAKIPAANARKVIRALEVISITGNPYSATLPSPVSRWNTVFIGLQPEPQLAKQRIATRAARMFEDGLVAEAMTLRKSGLGKTASQAIGYRQALAVARGNLSEIDAVAEITQLTERYAKRQRSWFRRDPRIHWLREPYDLQAALQLIG